MWRVSYVLLASLYALSQAAAIVAFIAVWMTARPLVGVAGALAALLIIDGIIQSQCGEVQSQCDRDAALGAGQLRLSRRVERARLAWILLGVALRTSLMTQILHM